MVYTYRYLATFAEGLEAAGPDCTCEPKVLAFVNPEFTVAHGGDCACYYRGKISEPGGDEFQAKALVDKQDKF